MVASVPGAAALLLLGQWFLLPSSLAFAWTPEQTLAVAAFGAAFLGVLFYFMMPLLRAEPAARFFAFGMRLAVVSVTAFRSKRWALLQRPE